MTREISRRELLPVGSDAVTSLDEEAALWLSELHGDAFSEADEQRFRAWISQSDAHASSLARLEQSWRDLDLLLVENALQSEADADTRSTSVSAHVANDNKPARFGKLLKWAAPLAAACAVIIGLMIIQNAPGSEPDRFRYASDKGEIKTVELADGTQLTLGARTTVTGSYTEGRRFLQLQQGRVFLDVVRDEDRPFIVESDNTQVRVLGTTFDVERGRDWVNVALASGRIEVGLRGKTDRENRVLEPGQKIRVFRDGQLGDVSRFDVASLSWRNGNLEYLNARLSDVVFELNRYRDVPILLADRDIGDLRVTFSVPSGETDVFLKAVEETLPVRAVETAGAVALYRK
ncbi:FecR family protein [Ponticaulis profundi]|uniref:FecR family protein n=1 Tax=Ponticaulis profundi TaxID=2665222 RepID=A0ABW1SAA2_9PROT